MNEYIIPKLKLTVIIRDDSWWKFQEPATYRTVHIDLTGEQLQQLALHKTGRENRMGEDITYYENIANCFLEGQLKER
jgi:hypothetical protein